MPDLAANNDQLPGNTTERPRSAMQFFLIPVLLVAALVFVWIFVGWMSKPVDDPQELIRDLQNPGQHTWQKALALAHVLRDPRHAEFRRSGRAADELSNLLRDQLAAARMSAGDIQLRIYLCRALGEFDCPEAMPALIEASRPERHPAEIEMRRAALEALAAWAAKSEPRPTDVSDRLTAAAMAACNESADSGEDRERRAALRATAAYTLGVVGGEQADQALTRLLADPDSDVRYNAATGLARHGQAEAIPVLVEMLDPENPASVSGESSQAGQEWKRALVITNALRAVRQLVEQNPSAARKDVRDTLQRLARGRVPAALQAEVRETLQAFPSQP